MNAGSIAITISDVAASSGKNVLDMKNSGKPISAAIVKHISWRFVRLSATFVFTFDNSFGIVTYAINITSFHLLI
jgi:hypothetical protein